MKSCGSGPCHDSKWLDSSAHHVLTQYIRIMKLHRSILEQRLNKTGVYRSQHQILTTLAEHSNASQKEIAEYLNVTAATIAVSVKKLEKGGYITRIVDQRKGSMSWNTAGSFLKTWKIRCFWDSRRKSFRPWKGIWSAFMRICPT